MSHAITHPEWEEKMSEKILTCIRHELYFELRYLKPALSAFVFQKKEGLLTFATDGTYLYYSTEPLFRIFKKNAKFLDRIYLHSVLHCIFRHLWLRGRRDRRLWNLSCDIAVEMVVDSLEYPCVKRILSLIRKRIYEVFSAKEGRSAAVIYRWLNEQEEEKIQELAREFYTDDHRYWPAKDEESPSCIQAREKWGKTGRQTALQQKRSGRELSGGEELLDVWVQAAKRRRSYGDFLKKFAVFWEEPHLDLDEFDLGYYTYGLNLYGNLPLIEPLETREVNKIRELVIVLDTSYSTSKGLISGFLRETLSILSSREHFFDICSIRVLQCDNRVQKDVKISGREDMERLIAEMEICGGGGTDFRPAFSYVEALRKNGEMQRPGGLLYFTDGKGIYPEKKPDYKTAFLFLEEDEEAQTPPWAMRLKLEPEDWTHEYETGKGRIETYGDGVSGQR